MRGQQTAGVESNGMFKTNLALSGSEKEENNIP